MAVGAIKNSFLVLIWKQGLRCGKREWIKTLVSGRASALFMTVWNAKEKEGFEIFKKYLSERNKNKRTSIYAWSRGPGRRRIYVNLRQASSKLF